MRMYSSILILKLINNVDIKSISQFPNMEQNNPKSFSAGFVTLQVVQLLPWLGSAFSHSHWHCFPRLLTLRAKPQILGMQNSMPNDGTPSAPQPAEPPPGYAPPPYDPSLGQAQPTFSTAPIPFAQSYPGEHIPGSEGVYAVLDLGLGICCTTEIPAISRCSKRSGQPCSTQPCYDLLIMF